MTDELKTQTIGPHEDSPGFSICEGHISFETFNKAFEAEGWQNGDWNASDNQVTHEYWRRGTDGFWIKSNVGDPEAVPVTVGAW